MSAFEDFIKEYEAVIAKVCYFYAEDVDNFKDLKQEALLHLWRGFDAFRGESKPSTWVYRVTLNSCVSYFRQHRRRAASEPIENHPELLADTADKGEMIAEMYRLINRLNRIDKAILLLWLDEVGYDEIAEIMRMPRNTVASRLKRSKEKLVQFSQQ